MAKGSRMMNSANTPPMDANKAARRSIVKAAEYRLFFFLYEINPKIFDVTIKSTISIMKNFVISFSLVTNIYFSLTDMDTLSVNPSLIPSRMESPLKIKKVNARIDSRIIEPKMMEGIMPFFFSIFKLPLSYVY
jgi:hypothetical protein